jgi:preprotein translocase subunit SecY
MDFRNILKNLPEVKGPIEKRLSFNTKLKWTLIILVGFFVMSNISLYGADPGFLQNFEYLAVILGTSFGSIISLGIGPIVMASIILQLLVGSKILDIDTSTEEGKKFFQGLQKLMVFLFIIFEALVYVLMGGIKASAGFAPIVVFQLMLGGIIILLMDEVCHKWGFGSGVSLFIAAGVGWRLVNATLGFIGPQGNFQASGKLIAFIVSLMNQDFQGAILNLAPIITTGLLFLVIVWAQSLKIEIPLSYDRLRGYGMKWPLQFFYTSNIPVILAGALIANLQLFGGLLQNWLGRPTFFGNIIEGTPVSGFLYWINSTDIVGVLITKSFQFALIFQSLGHILFFVIFSSIFALFWVKTSGMDASSQANNILKSGLQIPGFRKDKRILESILSRYIMPLTIMGGIAIGLLAAVADLLGALVGGTTLLLGIMITFQFYQSIVQQHAMDMNPGLKKVMGV